MKDLSENIINSNFRVNNNIIWDLRLMVLNVHAGGEKKSSILLSICSVLPTI